MAFLRYTDEGGNDVIITFDATEQESHEGNTLITEHPVEVGSNVSDHARSENDLLGLDVVISDTPLTSQKPIQLNDSDVDPFGFDGGPGEIRTSPSVFIATPPRRVGDPKLLIEGAPPTSISDVPGAGLVASFFNLGAVGGITGTAALNAKVVPGIDPVWEAAPLFEQGGVDRAFIVLQFTKPFDRVGVVNEELIKIRKQAFICEVTTRLRVYPDMLIESWAVNRDAQSGSSISGVLQFKQIRTVSSQTVAVTDALEPRGRKRAKRGKQVPQPATDKQEAKLQSQAPLRSTLAGTGALASF